MATISSIVYYGFQNGSNLIQSQANIADTGLLLVEDVLTGGQTKSIAVAYDVSAVTAVFVQVDQDGTTVNPGSGTSATLTFADATCPYVWQTESQYVNVWNDDFTTISVHNGNAVDDMNITIWVQYTA